MSAEPAPRPSSAALEPERCRELFRTLVAGVGIVTADAGSGPIGLTASTIVAVSLDPPLLLVSLANESSTLAELRAASTFAVNLLRGDQQQLADRFASRRAAWAKFADVELSATHPPVLDAALAAATCELVWCRQTGDHTLVLGSIRGVTAGGGRPLVWHGSAYHRLGEPAP
jgi:flavin reductase (DIM6/NTAB) family NADH-FMN oxidoreductase RutF